ncbi:glucose uptake inhibitor SgrT [Enterobacteriales bacterium SAP-6]|uniref:Glucose uptake inhibitor SgrT n=1 Tax=Acerihabitans arboris TaxID=2691583 RepID=A0A845SDZ8_9GAMM|nr:glucose uptake inhibitor SgrT [Acerihabitans arboris]
MTVLRQFYQRYFNALCGRGVIRPDSGRSGQRMALLLQVTQWHIDALSEDEYQHWT